ncbi:hypothetical protein [Pseudomonas sp. TE21394]
MIPSKKLSFSVGSNTKPELVAPVIVEAQQGVLDPAWVPNGATVRIGAEALVKIGETVVLTWKGKPGADPTVLRETAKQDGALDITASYELVVAYDGFSATLEYSIERNGGDPEGPSASSIYSVKSGLQPGTLKVMGARWSRGSYRASGASRLLMAFDNNTNQPLRAQWQYLGDTTWSEPAFAWRDTDPTRPLRVQSGSDLVVINTPNLIGNGVDTTVTGYAAFAAHRDTGDVVVWGNPAYGGGSLGAIGTMTDIAELSCTGSAFAARTHSGQVVAWGAPTQGGTTPVPGRAYVQVVGASTTFAAINDQGQVITWGKATTPPTANDLSTLISTGTAFAAMRRTGAVVAWGLPAATGTVPPPIDSFQDITEVIGNNQAFAALHGANRVVGWGVATAGGTVPDAIASLTDVVELSCANAQAFALRHGSAARGYFVKAWGAEAYGGTVDPIIGGFNDILTVVSTWQSFAAIRGNGQVNRVVAWGGTAGTGGVVPDAISALTDIVQVAGSSKAFAALRRTGEVVAWGDTTVGGQIDATVSAKLRNVRAIYANSHGFAALTADKKVVTWGHGAGGGDSSSADERLQGLVSYHALPAKVPASRALKAR